MLPQDIIRKKRDGGALSEEETTAFIKGVASKDISEGQVGAFCMAVLLQKMKMEERIALTRAMAHSGTVMDWTSENLPGPVLDKHSTGGVGDKVSLMLAPILAACGAYVPMLSGRGLGHTGGTLDKMDAIAGYVSQPDTAKFKKVVCDAGCAIIGATPDLAPADRIMYSVRDVTATVESLDLITASILSKKLAAGLQGLVMDVKFGSGAFMKDYKDAKELAQSIVSVANGAGLPTVALLTDMNEVLGHTAGNAVEVIEAVQFLKGENVDQRLYDVTVALCGRLLVLGKIADHAQTAEKMIAGVLQNGKAAEHFAKMVRDLGGPADMIEAPEKHVKAAAVIKPFYPVQSGTVTAIDVFKVGMGIVAMGGGRRVPSDKVDHAVGLTDVTGLGTKVGKGGAPFAVIHAANEDSWNAMAAVLQDAVKTGDAPAKTPLIRETIEA